MASKLPIATKIKLLLICTIPKMYKVQQTKSIQATHHPTMLYNFTYLFFWISFIYIMNGKGKIMTIKNGKSLAIETFSNISCLKTEFAINHIWEPSLDYGLIFFNYTAENWSLLL